MSITENALVKVLDGCYEQALKGLPGTGSYTDLAREYDGGSLEHFISWQTMKCAATGFASGLGGLFTLPVTVPLDVAANLYVQLRMIAVIAHLNGHNARSDRVKAMALACLLGNEAKEIVKDISIEMSRMVAQRLVARAAQRGFTQLGRLVPLVGGVVGGTIDALACQAVAGVAKRVFRENVS
jgi:hypothetical protein